MIWIELICDQCSINFPGTSSKSYREQDYLRKARDAGWLTRREHLCPLCLHERTSGHRVNTSVGTCLQEGCRLNRYKVTT